MEEIGIYVVIVYVPSMTMLDSHCMPREVWYKSKVIFTQFFEQTIPNNNQPFFLHYLLIRLA